MIRFFGALGKVIAYLVAVVAVMAIVAIPVRAIFGESESVGEGVSLAVIGVMMTMAVAVTNGVMVWVGKS